MTKYCLMHQKAEIRKQKVCLRKKTCIGRDKNLDLKFSDLSVLFSTHGFRGEKLKQKPIALQFNLKKKKNKKLSSRLVDQLKIERDFFFSWQPEDYRSKTQSINVKFCPYHWLKLNYACAGKMIGSLVKQTETGI